MESEEWWKEHGRMVEVVVQCTHPRQDFNYPPYAAKSKVYRVRVDPRSKTYRQRELDQALPKIQDALLAGQDVIFHCMQSFHRAPVTAAAAYRRVTGGSASVHTCCMTAVVAATSQIKYFLVWFHYVFFTVNLIGVISICCLCLFPEVIHYLLFDARNHEPIDVIHRRCSTGSRLRGRSGKGIGRRTARGLAEMTQT